jgi:hypothetical protein
VKKRFLMSKIFTIICFILTEGCGNLWGAEGFPIVNFIGVSETTHNLLGGYIRCGMLIKPLVPTKHTPILRAIKGIGSYSLNVVEKTKQVKGFLDGFVNTVGEEFSAECSLANPTLKLPSIKSCQILALLRRDLEFWLDNHGAFLEG